MGEAPVLTEKAGGDGAMKKAEDGDCCAEELRDATSAVSRPEGKEMSMGIDVPVEGDCATTLAGVEETYAMAL